MLKVLLVDDEILTIRMLQSLIDWEKYNLELVGYAQDGAEAYEAFLKHEPHIVITDINMPLMTGIEFIKKARTADPHAQFILISAYGDFSYVQKAMKLGCSDYILKPIDEEELDEAVKKAADKVIGEKEKEHMIEKSVQKMRKMELHSYMRTGNDSKRIERHREDYSFPFEDYYLLLLQLNHHTIDEYVNMQQIELLQMSYINRVLEDILTDYKYILLEYEQDSWTILLAEIDPGIRHCLSEKIRDMLKSQFKINVIACFSDAIRGIEDLPEQYKRTKLLCRYNFYVDGEDILGFGYNCKEEDFKQIKNTELLKEIEASLLANDLGSSERIINEIFYLSKNINPAELNLIYELCFQIILILKNLIRQKNEGEEPHKEISDLTYPQLLERENMKSLKEFMLQAIGEVLSQDDTEPERYSSLVEESIAIIKENYNKNLTLEDICTQISVSKNYFSYLFKREVGINLWSYLTELRLEKAKELLLETDMKSYEISFQVGYENPSYFSMLFKKHESVTPNEYRKRKR